jgi:PTS system sucrose-specific IIC component
MTNQELAQKILEAVGPAANVVEAHNCMTRLRLHVRRETFTAETLKQIPGVLGTNKSDDEWQIVLGPGKATNVTNAFNKLVAEAQAAAKAAGSAAASGTADKADVSATPAAATAAGTAPSFSDLQQHAQIGDGQELHNAIRKRNATPGKLLLKKIANIFVPLVPAFIGCGLITSILSLCFKFNPALAQIPFLQVLAVAGNAIFWGMNLFVGFNTAKEFGGSPILGGVMAAVISHPGLANITLFGDKLVPGRGGIIAVLLIAFFTAELEKWLHKHVPDILDLFLTPFLVVLLSTFVAIGVCQPVGSFLSEVIGAAATTAVNKGGALTGFIMGGCWLPLVMLGIHQGMTPIHAELLNHFGIDILLPIQAMAGCGQVGAALAVYCKTKNAALKKTVAVALPIGIMGVGEPLIYGVTFPLGKPFIGACIGGACGGVVQAIFVVGAFTMGISGLPLVASTDKMVIYLAGLLVAYVAGFIATWLLGFDDPEEV